MAQRTKFSWRDSKSAILQMRLMTTPKDKKAEVVEQWLAEHNYYMDDETQSYFAERFSVYVDKHGIECSFRTESKEYFRKQLNHKANIGVTYRKSDFQDIVQQGEESIENKGSVYVKQEENLSEFPHLLLGSYAKMILHYKRENNMKLLDPLTEDQKSEIIRAWMDIQQEIIAERGTKEKTESAPQQQAQTPEASMSNQDVKTMFAFYKQGVIKEASFADAGVDNMEKVLLSANPNKDVISKYYAGLMRRVIPEWDKFEETYNQAVEFQKSDDFGKLSKSDQKTISTLTQSCERDFVVGRAKYRDPVKSATAQIDQVEAGTYPNMGDLSANIYNGYVQVLYDARNNTRFKDLKKMLEQAGQTATPTQQSSSPQQPRLSEKELLDMLVDVQMLMPQQEFFQHFRWWGSSVDEHDVRRDPNMQEKLQDPKCQEILASQELKDLKAAIDRGSELANLVYGKSYTLRDNYGSRSDFVKTNLYGFFKLTPEQQTQILEEGKKDPSLKVHDRMKEMLKNDAETSPAQTASPPPAATNNTKPPTPPAPSGWAPPATPTPAPQNPKPVPQQNTTQQPVDSVVAIKKQLLRLAFNYDIICGYYNNHIAGASDADKPVLQAEKDLFIRSGIKTAHIIKDLEKPGADVAMATGLIKGLKDFHDSESGKMQTHYGQKWWALNVTDDLIVTTIGAMQQTKVVQSAEGQEQTKQAWVEYFAKHLNGDMAKAQRVGKLVEVVRAIQGNITPEQQAAKAELAEYFAEMGIKSCEKFLVFEQQMVRQGGKTA